MCFFSVKGVALNVGHSAQVPDGTFCPDRGILGKPKAFPQIPGNFFFVGEINNPQDQVFSMVEVVSADCTYFYFYILKTFLQLYCDGISFMGNLGCFSGGKSAETESRYPTYGVCWVFSVSIIHGTLTWTTGALSLMCAQMHAVAHGGVWTQWESLHWKLTLRENSLPASGNQSCIGRLLVWCSTNWATSELCCHS